MTATYKDIVYILISINRLPLAEYYEKEGNFRNVALNQSKTFKKGRYVINNSR